MSVIAIDFDGTFTDDKDLWAGFIRSARDAGHDVVCVTARRETEDNTRFMTTTFKVWDCQIPIVFTDGGAKRDVTNESGVDVDIWIDNDPTAIVGR